MKIIIAQDFLRSGGTERQSVLLANAFSFAGHRVTLLTFRPGGPLSSTVSDAVNRVVLQRFDTHLDWFAPRLAPTVTTLQPDVILCMGRMANCYGTTLEAAARSDSSNTVVVGTMRTGRKLPWLFRQSLRNVSHVVANSRAAQTVLVREYDIPPGKISVIHNSLVFPANDGETRNERLRAEHKASGDTRVLLDVAMFRPEKNQRELITIAAGLPANFPWQLWLAGDGPELNSCRKLAQSLSIADRVKFFGFMSDPAPLYAAADLAVHASLSESLSNFLIEAQAHGLPAVAYAAQGVEECFLPDDTGMAIPCGDQDAFRTAVQRFAGADPARTARAREYARSTFDQDRQIQAYLEIFEQLTQV
ncbi:MAG: glycosyltransferase [Cephaloticoccus sp.]|nr:glycosyltransferase [Cephaloticoccus sp.]MCF7759406.1 glycosyltransferase [Cephaloticoccus sp.]